MFLNNFYISLAVTVGLVGICHGKVEVNEDEDGKWKDGKISFSTPDLTDDEQHSPFMPDLLKCDACKAIAYQVRFHYPYVFIDLIYTLLRTLILVLVTFWIQVKTDAEGVLPTFCVHWKM